VPKPTPHLPSFRSRPLGIFHSPRPHTHIHTLYDLCPLRIYPSPPKRMHACLANAATGVVIPYTCLYVVVEYQRACDGIPRQWSTPHLLEPSIARVDRQGDSRAIGREIYGGVGWVQGSSHLGDPPEPRSTPEPGLRISAPGWANPEAWKPQSPRGGCQGPRRI
jgi:hypothetical protein